MKKTVTVYDIGSRRIDIEKDDEYTAVVLTKLPLYPLGNYVQLKIVLDAQGNLTAYEVRDTWNGTGRFDIGSVKLRKNEAEELRKKMESIKGPDDFAEVEKIFDRILSTEQKKFDDVLDNLLRRVSKLFEKFN